MAAKDFKVQVVAQSKHYSGCTSFYSENILFKLAFDSCIVLSYSVFVVKNNQGWPFYFITGMSFQWLLGRYWDYKIFL